MRVIHEIGWEIIIFLIQPFTKANHLLLWLYPVKLILVLNRSAKQVSRSGSKHYTVSNVQDTKTGVDLCLLFRLSYKGIFLLVDNSFCFQIDAHFLIRKMCHSNFCENRGQCDQFARKKKQINKLMCLCNLLM